jgi:hypothetical protein
VRNPGRTQGHSGQPVDQSGLTDWHGKALVWCRGAKGQKALGPFRAFLSGEKGLWTGSSSAAQATRLGLAPPPKCDRRFLLWPMQWGRCRADSPGYCWVAPVCDAPRVELLAVCHFASPSLLVSAQQQRQQQRQSPYLKASTLCQYFVPLYLTHGAELIPTLAVLQWLLLSVALPAISN